MKRALHITLSIIKRTLESGAVVPGGGVKSALSIYLEQFATTLVRMPSVVLICTANCCDTIQGSREQLAIAEFASALLSIPAVNAGKDSTEPVAKSQHLHSS
jgi:T-complex protein 1 subunit alpha